MATLTQTQITKAKPRAKPYTPADGHGVSLVVMPTGSKLWRFKFTLTGKQKIMAL